jgi:hypothetical protein
MSDNQKPAEQELKNEKQEMELNDLPKDLSESEMQDVNGGTGWWDNLKPSRKKRRTS